MSDLRKKRAPTIAEPMTVGARRTDWPPRCRFTGLPTAESSPYMGGCGGDQGRHVRTAVDSA